MTPLVSRSSCSATSASIVLVGCTPGGSEKRSAADAASGGCRTAAEQREQLPHARRVLWRQRIGPLPSAGANSQAGSIEPASSPAETRASNLLLVPVDSARAHVAPQTPRLRIVREQEAREIGEFWPDALRALAGTRGIQFARRGSTPASDAVTIGALVAASAAVVGTSSCCRRPPTTSRRRIAGIAAPPGARRRRPTSQSPRNLKVGRKE